MGGHSLQAVQVKPKSFSSQIPYFLPAPLRKDTMSRPPHKDQLRTTMAYEAARIIDESGEHDYHKARIKAAQRLRCRDKNSLPSNSEIEQALIENRLLFHADEQKSSIRALLHLAQEAMSSLQQFSPRLVGSILRGTADSNTPLQLHLFADSPEQIAFALIQSGIPYLEGDKTLSFPREEKRRQPLFRFQSGTREVELICFPPETIGHPPLSQIDQRPEKRVSLSQLNSLLENEYGPFESNALHISL